MSKTFINSLEDSIKAYSKEALKKIMMSKNENKNDQIIKLLNEIKCLLQRRIKCTKLQSSK